MQRNIFSKDYWRQAALELKSPKMLVFAALMIALRVALKSLSIPIIPGQLTIGVAFFINALGAFTFGPVTAIIAAMVSDTLGAMLFPQGAYFFPYIFIEIAGSLIFALFLYNQKLSVGRIMLSRFCVVLVCNIILTPLVNIWYSGVTGEAIKPITELRIVKNLLCFPAESLLLVLFFSAALKALKAAKFIAYEESSLKIKPLHIVLLVLLSLAAIAAFVIYREIRKPGTFPFLSFIH